MNDPRRRRRFVAMSIYIGIGLMILFSSSCRSIPASPADPGRT